MIGIKLQLVTCQLLKDLMSRQADNTASLFGWLVADGWCWFVLREEYCWLVMAGGWFVLREKYCWLVADKPSEQGARKILFQHARRSTWDILTIIRFKSSISDILLNRIDNRWK
jgi:hypothetical protein